jgi:putative transposase
MLRRPPESDPYCSIEYQAELRKHGVQISMSGKGNCYDNFMVEAFFKTLKSELVWRTAFQTRAEASQALARYIDGFYNPVRRHSALDLSAPPSSKGAPAKPLSIKPRQVRCPKATRVRNE